MSKLTVIARITTSPDKIDFVKGELENLIPLTRAEEGCICYDLHQDNENPNHFLFYETWENKELWQSHLESDHIQKYRAATKDSVIEFTLNEMTKIV